MITTGTLFGSGLLTLWVGLQAYRFTYRTLLLVAAALMSGTGLGFAAFTAEDVVRHELVARIVAAYDKADAARRRAPKDGPKD